MNIDYISIGRNPPEEVNAIIEVPIGGEPIKNEMDKKAGTLVVDRFLYTPMRYPGNSSVRRNVDFTFTRAKPNSCPGLVRPMQWTPSLRCFPTFFAR
jgi:hypothetical protein